MGLSIAQSAQSGTTDLVSTSLAVTWPQNTHTGSMIVVCCNGGVQHITSITDSQGNVYVAANIGSFTWSACEIWYAKNITGGTTPTVTVSFTAMASTVQVFEVQGADKDSPLSVNGNNKGDGVTSNQPTVTTSTTGAGLELLFVTGSVFLASGTDVFSANSGFSNFLGNNSTPTSGPNTHSGSESRIVSPSAVVAGLTMATTGTTWEITYATFKALRNYPSNSNRNIKVENGMGRSENAS